MTISRVAIYRRDLCFALVSWSRLVKREIDAMPACAVSVNRAPLVSAAVG